MKRCVLFRHLENSFRCVKIFIIYGQQRMFLLIIKKLDRSVLGFDPAKSMLDHRSVIGCETSKKWSCNENFAIFLAYP